MQQKLTIFEPQLYGLVYKYLTSCAQNHFNLIMFHSHELIFYLILEKVPNTKRLEQWLWLIW